jgi:Fe-S cluster biosynthesis and repair protein YggX
MTERMVKCVKLGREAPGLDRQPFKGDFGKKIYDTVSKEAWRMWLEHSKMFVNEYRLDMTSPAHQKTWFNECEKYFYGEGSAVPAEFKPQGAGGAAPPAGGHSHDHGHAHDHGHSHDHAKGGHDHVHGADCDHSHDTKK